jgi:RNA polymerase sigma-70 factor (ECF subfamily)
MIEGVIRRVPGGWQDFFKKHERLVLACLRRVYARYHVPLPQEEMEDLVGAVCLDLVRDDYRKLRLFDPDRGYRLSSWVGLIATNVAHDALRRRAPYAASTDDQASPLAELPSPLPDPLDQADHREQVELLARAVAYLSPTEQEFIRRYYVEGHTPEEIAEATGVSVNTVYSRKNKVRAKLVRLVEDLTRSGTARRD